MNSTAKKNPRDDGDDESDGDSMFAASDDDGSSSASEPHKKRRRIDSQNLTNDSHNGSSPESKGNGKSSKTVDPELLEHAKSRLSKFAARLFDPNRIKGLVEGPITIPLNDEFLKAFGQREKKMDQQLGREEEINHEIIDEDGETDADTNGNGKEKAAKSNSKDNNNNNNKKKEVSTCKVKVTNLAYRTTEETLTNVCLRFGDVAEVIMINDGPATSNSNFHNSGLAYVKFDSEEGAQSCIESLKSLDGRQIRVTLAPVRSKKNPNDFSRGSGGSLLNNQSKKDISTVCFRCGQVGHMESNCPNPRKPKPCSLCGSTEHDFRACPKKQVCFNCGTPGHVRGDCPMRRGLPRRMVCGTCFQSGHHRLQCKQRGPPPYITASAVCMDCGKRGHFLCKELKWFYGLRGMSCFNCGGQDHSGYDCNRPTLYQCSTNPDEALREIQRAEADSIAEELERERRQQRERERGRNDKSGSNGKKRRAKSSGPSRSDRRGYR